MEQRFKTKLAAHFIQNKQCSNFLNALFHGNKTNKFSIKFIKLVLNTLLKHKFINYEQKQKDEKS